MRGDEVISVVLFIKNMKNIVGCFYKIGAVKNVLITRLNRGQDICVYLLFLFVMYLICFFR